MNFVQIEEGDVNSMSGLLNHGLAVMNPPFLTHDLGLLQGYSTRC